jgi:hypothetical protein
MLLTVAALFVGVLFVAPLVRQPLLKNKELQTYTHHRSAESRSTHFGRYHRFLLSGFFVVVEGQSQILYK